MINDVMVFIPVYRLEPETVEAVLALEWDGPVSWVFQRDNPTKGGGRAAGVSNHLHQYQRGRETFLAGRYDAMLVIESDIIPPADTLPRLAAVDADIAYGVYRFRQTECVNVFEKYYADRPKKTARNVGESLSIDPEKWSQAKAAKVVPVSGAGLGCVLIKRHVLEAMSFRLMEEQPSVHCDTPFTNDAYRQGYNMMADMRVLCGHKRADGVTVWPPS